LEEEAEEPLLREVIYEFSIYMVLVIQYFEREFTLSISTESVWHIELFVVFEHTFM
jgi:hypothetical protein